jgi:L-ascorbate metabolism protein UlaG (beta-lactamase superfamily)
MDPGGEGTDPSGDGPGGDDLEGAEAQPGKKVRKMWKRVMLWVLSILGILAVVAFFSGWFFLNRIHFGALPTGARLERILASPNYRDGNFQNLIPTPVMTPDGQGFMGNVKELVFPAARQRPTDPIPTEKIDDLSQLPGNSLLWFGHSAFLVKLAGKTFLFDPSLGASASPVSWVVKPFKGTDGYGPADLPKIDYLFISHDHWDHLDYGTVTYLKAGTPKVICPLGVGAHLDRWGFEPGAVEEGDWWDVFEPEPSLKITFIPARHFSGRGLKRNQSLWTGFLLEYGGKKLFYSGDGGYLPQYAEFGRQIGPVDLAIMECGQYNDGWKLIHMSPEESVQAALDMGAKAAMPVHSGKFRIANHAWDDPFIRFKAAADKVSLKVVSPKIGEIVDLDDPGQSFQDWWVGIN